MFKLKEINRPRLFSFAHLATKRASWLGYRRFKRSLKQTEKTQREKLKHILQAVEGTELGERYSIQGGMTWELFSQKVPVTSYADWSPLIEKQRAGSKKCLTHSPCQRYQPTSGSTSQVKWIPYTNAFLKELDSAVSPWMTDMYRSHPGIGQGKHYWSFSWVPTELRETVSGDINDDLKLLPWWKRKFMAMTKAVPDEVSLANTSDDSLFATLCFLLANRELSFLSVWSPTFALTLLDVLALHRRELSDALEFGSWGERSESLKKIECPQSLEVAQYLDEWDGRISRDFISKLWPSLTLISAWDTSTSAIWAKKLSELFPQASFKGKGLWATEGVVTIPFQNKYPLAICSHFYEFMDIKTNRVYPSWGLHIGQEVYPLLTTGSGLLRYMIKDKLKVSDFLNDCPCFEFLGRMDGVDMVGEKLSTDLASDIISQFSKPFLPAVDVRPLSLLAVPSSYPFYLLLCEVDKNVSERVVSEMKHKLAERLEAELQKSFHYKLARDLGQLDHATVHCSHNARELYLERGNKRGMVSGNIKVEPLVLWDGELTFDYTHKTYNTTISPACKDKNIIKDTVSHGC